MYESPAPPPGISSPVVSLLWPRYNKQRPIPNEYQLTKAFQPSLCQHPRTKQKTFAKYEESEYMDAWLE